MYSQDELVRAEPCAESRQCEGHGLDSYAARKRLNTDSPASLRGQRYEISHEAWFEKQVPS